MHIRYLFRIVCPTFPSFMLTSVNSMHNKMLTNNYVLSSYIFICCDAFAGDRFFGDKSRLGFAFKICSLNYKPWRIFLIVCGFPGLLCSLIIYILLESPQFILTVGEVTTKVMYRWDNTKEPFVVS